MTDNKDLTQRFDKLEARLDSMSMYVPFSTFQSPSSKSGEIDLRELFYLLWQGKWWVLVVTFLFLVVGIFYAFNMPEMYRSEGIYALSQNDAASIGASGQLGGLASLAGVNIGGRESKDVDQALAIMASWPFLEGVIEKYDLAPLIVAVKGWDRETGDLLWDHDIYDPSARRWATKTKASPTSFEVYSALRRMLSISFDENVSMMNVSVEYYSPIIAKEWVQIIVDEINENFRLRDKIEAKKNIEYLKAKASETGISEMQTVFYGMIEMEMKTLMLAEVDEQYLIRQVVEPREPERRSSPNRIAILLVTIFLGGFVSSLVVLIVGFARR